MSFKEQMQADNAVFFNTEEFAESATLATVSGDEFDILIIRQGQTDLITADPGHADSDTFDVCKTNPTDEISISPNDKITTSDEVVWVVQLGVRHDSITGSWSVPVLSDGRVKA